MTTGELVFILLFVLVSFVLAWAVSALVQASKSTPCLACRKRISTKATVCPYCRSANSRAGS